MAKQEYFDNGYTFTVDDSGTITGDGYVPAQGVECGSRVTPKGMQPGDHRGHVISAQEGGPNKSYNMTAQDGKLNQGAYKTVENTEATLVKQGHVVHTSKTAYVSTQQGGRPDAYMINDTITSSDGKTQNVHLSFQNMSPEEQAEQNQILLENDFFDNYPNPDPLRESMTHEEYSSMVKETEQNLPSVKDEFALDNCSQVTFDSDSVTQGEASQSGTESGSQGIATSTGTESGADAGVGVGCAVDM